MKNSSSQTGIYTDEALKRAKNSGTVLSVIMCTLSFWVICVSAWRYFGEPIPVFWFSKLVIVIVLVPGIILAKMQGFTLEDMGLGIKGHSRAIRNGVIITLALLAFLPLLKLALIRLGFSLFEGETEFINWKKYPFSEYVFYVFSVIIQNIAARSLMQTLISRSLVSKHADSWAIVIASLMFAAMHTHLDFMYIIGSGCMFALFGLVYKHDKTIWGLCIPHYVLGMVGGLMNFID